MLKHLGELDSQNSSESGTTTEQYNFWILKYNIHHMIKLISANEEEGSINYSLRDNRDLYIWE